jgi:hypothetical protein
LDFFEFDKLVREREVRNNYLFVRLSYPSPVLFFPEIPPQIPIKPAITLSFEEKGEEEEGRGEGGG